MTRLARETGFRIRELLPRATPRYVLQSMAVSLLHAEGAEAGTLHRAQELGGRGRRREIRGIELHAHPAARDGLADLQRMTRRRVERGIDEIEMMDSGFGFQLLDLVGNKLRVARAITPALDVAVSAVDTLIDAPAFRLDGDGGAVTLVAREIDPAMEARWR